MKLSIPLPLFVLFAVCPLAAAVPECSTEKVNGDCQVTIDRLHPIALPTIQVRPNKSVTVVVKNPLPYEALSLDAQSAQAVAGTDQLAGFVTAAMPDLKAIVFSSNPELPRLRGGAPVVRTPVQTVQDDLQNLDLLLENPKQVIDRFIQEVTEVYSQLQEILAPLPRPMSGADPARIAGIPQQTPLPWMNYPLWRSWMLCELVGCPADGRSPATPFTNLLGEASRIQALLPASTAGAAAAWPKLKAGQNSQDLLFDSDAFTAGVANAQKDIAALPGDQRDNPFRLLGIYQMRESVLRNTLAAYPTAIAAMTKDLGTVYLVSIDQLPGTANAPQILGQIQDPKSSSTIVSSATKLLGRQVSFSASGVNQVASFVASVPAASAKKTIVTITVLFADPIFEVSTGAFFSTLPSRSFSNQTLVTQGSPPVPGNVVIAQTVTRPTILPYVAGNWRLGHDFAVAGRRRGALYATAALALNPYNTSAEFAGGLSFSWRTLIVSGLYHAGRDVQLTQGEYVGEIWCNATAAQGSIPKCSSPPSPSTEKYWTSAFAIGLGIRIPSLFGGAGH